MPFNTIIPPPPFASATVSGVVSTTTQTFAGAKTFNDNVTLSTAVFVLGQYATGSLPLASSYEGGLVYDSTTNEVKFSDGSSWTAMSGGGGGGVTTMGAIGASPNANAATISGVTLNLEPASASFGGVVTTGTQTFAGTKTIGGAGANLILDSTDTAGTAANLTVQNNAGTFGAPFIKLVKDTVHVGSINGYDSAFTGLVNGITIHAVAGKEIGFRVDTTSIAKFTSGGDFLVDTNTLYVDATNNRVGVGTATPTKALDVVGQGVFSDILGLAKIATGSLPAAAAGNKGYIVYDSTTNTVKFSDGSAWANIDTAGGAGVTTMAAIGASPNANGATISGATLNLEPASASFGGVVTTGAQTFAGVKTFPSIITTAGGLEARNDVGGGTGAWINVGTPSTGRFGVGQTGSVAYAVFNYAPVTFNNSNATFTSSTIVSDSSITGTSLVATASSGNALVVDTNAFVVDATNNRIGVGTATPTKSLDVVGQGVFSDILGLAQIATGSLPAAAAGNEGYIVYDATTNTVKFSDGATWANIDAGGGGGMSIGGAVTSGTAGSLLFVGSGPVLAQDNASLFFDDTNNRLGVGTASPGWTLDVQNTTTAVLGRFKNLSASGYSAINFDDNGGTNKLSLGYGNGSAAAPYTGKNYWQSGAADSVFVGGSTAHTSFDTSGNWTFDTSTLYVDATNNRVGIGTASPAYVLDAQAGAGVVGRIKNTSASAYSAINFDDSSNAVKMSFGYGNASASSPYASKVYLQALAGFNFVNGSNVAHTTFDTNGYWVFSGSAVEFQCETFGRFNVGGGTGVWAQYGTAGTQRWAVGQTGGVSYVNTSNCTANYSSANIVSDSTITAATLVSTGGLTVDTNTLVVDNTNNRVGIVNASPAQALDVVGNVRFSGALMPANDAGTTGLVLTSAGAGAPPIWNPSAGPPSYGELYENNDSGSNITVTTAGTYYQWVTTTTGVGNGGTDYVIMSAGANDYLKIGTIGAGVYKVDFSMSISAPTAAVVSAAIFLNGTITKLVSSAKSVATGDQFTVGTTGHLSGLVADDLITLRVTSSTNSDVVTVYHADMNIHRIA